MFIYTCKLLYKAFQNGYFKNNVPKYNNIQKTTEIPPIVRKSPHQAILKEVSVFTTNLE